MHTKMTHRNEKWAFIGYLGRVFGGKQLAIWSWRLNLKAQGKSKSKPPSPRPSGEGMGAHLPEHQPLLSLLCMSHRGQTAPMQVTGNLKQSVLGSPADTLSARRIPAPPALVLGKGEAKENYSSMINGELPGCCLHPAELQRLSGEGRGGAGRAARHAATPRRDPDGPGAADSAPAPETAGLS